MRKRKMIRPGDPVYYDKKGRIFKSAKEGRVYIGEYSLGNKRLIKEGKEVILR